jgi:hypothetical protein
MDTNKLSVDLEKLAAKYPYMLPLFANNLVHDQTPKKLPTTLSEILSLRPPQNDSSIRYSVPSRIPPPWKIKYADSYNTTITTSRKNLPPKW